MFIMLISTVQCCTCNKILFKSHLDRYELKTIKAFPKSNLDTAMLQSIVVHLSKKSIPFSISEICINFHLLVILMHLENVLPNVGHGDNAIQIRINLDNRGL
jgi:hypothetical protein